MFPWARQGDNLIIVVDGAVRTLTRDTHAAYDAALEAIKVGDWDQVRKITDHPSKLIVDYARGHLTIHQDTLFWKNVPIQDFLAQRILQMWKEGFDITPMVEFLTNLRDNPSETAIAELYPFLEIGGNPITPDGCFLAFKRIRKDWTDVWSGKIDNSIGKVVAMDRDEVCAVREQLCSSGLHFCSLSYLHQLNFGENMETRLVIIKINPRDVVSIPTDYNNTKGRCCRYEVVSEMADSRYPTSPLTKAVETGIVEQPKSPKKLSMTPNAIRKRQKRAEERARKQSTK